ncbi:C2H2 type zinc-finger-domain-containing protein [Lasiosphaeris hirsuta]|uniref:C2H2 type zinc-finger-domain-containing protein n=1 Tax=Lasiosphaeris hirsuta TaxID=260670 RepID=A0AA40DTU3_9PEZI|nr:C2H2 type zinc-finger-domain-containing protein [Lasiosphaeris hirsuta]
MESVSVFKLSLKSCNACNASFENAEVQRLHAKTQWHLENLRRRIANLSPIGSDWEGREGHEATDDAPSTEDSRDDSAQYTAQDSAEEYDTYDDIPRFISEQCLFCNELSETFDVNMSHMHKTHGLLIPDDETLIVDMETLIGYLHLVLYGYRECLFCRSERRTVEAAQQHMVGKGHCKLNLDDLDSEYRDFFDFASGSDGPLLSHAYGQSARLSSGRTVAHRAAAPSSQSRPHRDTRISTTQAPKPAGVKSDSLPTARNSGPSQALTKKERREAAFEKQLANLSVRDRASLMHLTSAQQRSVIKTRNKHQDDARRAAQRYRAWLDLLGEKRK